MTSAPALLPSQSRLRSSRLRIALFGVTGVVMWAALSNFTVASHHPVSISGASPAEVRAIVESLDLFVAAGLSVPKSHIHVANPDSRMCQRRPVHGYALESHVGNYVWLCTVQPKTVVHEMAHIWTYQYLNRPARAAWADRRGADAWRGSGVEWKNSGAEHAADILTWYVYFHDAGLHPRRISGTTSAEGFLEDVAWLIAVSDDPAPGAEDRLMVMGGELATIDESDLVDDAPLDDDLLPAVEADPIAAGSHGVSPGP
ncbi:hypothetical protein BH23ACT5_BH23ACT5_20460 [soil metagenome]